MTRVLVGVIANDAARFSEFWSCVLRLKVPIGSTKENVIGGDWCSARNSLARRCIDEEYDYLWFMDDDHSFAPDLLQKLLHSAMTYDLPIVNPLCTTRTAPFHLVTFVSNPDPDSTDRYLPISLDGTPGEGVIELEAGGCAGMLIRRDVLEATRDMARRFVVVDPGPGLAQDIAEEVVPDQWFEYTDRSEDITFCEKAKEAGFKLYADLSCRLGHITTAVVMPGEHDGQWITGVTIGRDFQLVIPRAEDLLREQERELGLTEETTVLADDEFIPLADAELARQQAALELGLSPGPAAPPREEGSSPAERIEIWVDEEFHWWWRAISHDGAILRKDSGVSEQTVIGAAHLFYPDVTVFLIQREEDDSRNLRQYGVPGRMFHRD